MRLCRRILPVALLGWMAWIGPVPPGIRAQVVQEFPGLGRVNWTAQVLQTTGVGQAPATLAPGARHSGAIESAKKDASQKLLLMLFQLPYSAELNVQQAVTGKKATLMRLRNVLRHLQVDSLRNLSTGEVEADVHVSLAGPLLDALLPVSVKAGKLMVTKQPLCPLCGQPWPKGKPVPEGVKLIQPPGGGAEGAVYSGLVVDARNLGAQPAFLPRIVDEKGNVVYSLQFARRNYAVELGLVKYDSDFSRAIADERVADHPLVVKAVGVQGTHSADIVLSHSDALMIHAAAANQNFLQRCRVIVLVGE